MSSTGLASWRAPLAREETYLPNFIDQGVIGMDVLEQFARVVIDFRVKEIELVPFVAEANAAN